MIVIVFLHNLAFYVFNLSENITRLAIQHFTNDFQGGLQFNSGQSMEQYEKIYLYQRIVRAKLFIDDHYADPIDLRNIAGQAHFSKFHFIRLFKSLYGKTPNHYLIKVRIDNAKILLTKGYTVLETCVRVGFDSPTSFAAMFKRMSGQTPSMFQKAQEVKKNAIQANPFVFVPNCFVETQGWTK